MPAGGAVIAGAAAVGGKIVGDKKAGEHADAASASANYAASNWINLHVPDPAQQRIELEHFKVTGQLSPKLQQVYQQEQTGLKNLKVDPASRAAEIQALTQMQNVASKGGMDEEAKQAEAQAINTSNANEAGQRGAIEQQFAARGQGGSGAHLAALLQASQGDSNQAAATGLSSAASAQQRALQAMASSGQMASNLNSQDYTQAAKAAEAQDAINRFNAQNSQNVAGSNVEAENRAQASNLANQQAVSNANTEIANKQEAANKALYQQQYNNDLKKVSGQGNAANQVSNQENLNATNTANQWSGIGQAVSTGVGAIADYKNKQNNSSDTPTVPDEEE